MDSNRLKNFLERKCSPEEAHEVLVWINSEEGKKHISENFDEYSGFENIEVSSDLIFENIISQIKEEPSVNEVKLEVHEVKRSAKIWKLLPVAASILIVLSSLIGGVLMGYLNEEEITQQENLIHKATEKGQKLTIHLSDGSKIKLNSESSVSYPARFTGDQRPINLVGEAYFEVAEDKTKPFIVSTKTTSTTALGTSFTVKSYPKKPEQVCLLTGKVKVELNKVSSQKTVLLPGGRASVVGKELNQDVFNVQKETAWLNGILYFDKTPFAEVVEQLEMWYGVEIRVEGKSPTNLYTSSKFDNDDLGEVLVSLGFSWGFTYQMSDEEIVLIFNSKKKNI